MRIGVFGGSFDPIHRGHLLLADCCWRQAELDRVIFVPNASQPLKPRGPVASETARLEMVRRAIAGQPEFTISTVEVERGGMSYTIDTLRELQRQCPGDELFLLMGADALGDFPRWREPRAICELATPLVVQRAGSPPPDFASLATIVSATRLDAIKQLKIEMPATPISSSDVRGLIASGGEWHSLVAPSVAAYIEERRLYRSA